MIVAESGEEAEAYPETLVAKPKAGRMPPSHAHRITKNLSPVDLLS